jgi:acetyl esterase/lipase
MLRSHVKRTVAFTQVHGKSLELDLYAPQAETTPRTPQPAVLFWHGGYLVRKSFYLQMINIFEIEIVTPQ